MLGTGLSMRRPLLSAAAPNRRSGLDCTPACASLAPRIRSRQPAPTRAMAAQTGPVRRRNQPRVQNRGVAKSGV